MGTDHTAEKMKGVAKETAGEMTGKDDLERAGEAQQKKAQESEEAERLEEEAEQKKKKAEGYEGEQKSRE